MHSIVADGVDLEEVYLGLVLGGVGVKVLLE